MSTWMSAHLERAVQKIPVSGNLESLHCQTPKGGDIFLTHAHWLLL